MRALSWMRNVALIARERPGDSAQRARVVDHYDRLGSRYGKEGRGLFDRFWSRWVRPREVRAVVETIDAQPGDRILDVGCGSGTYARLLAKGGLRVVAVDSSARMVDATRPLVEEALVADIETLALGRRFDRVICLGVLDFVAEPARCLANLANHVNEGGRLIVLVPRRGLAGLYYRVAKLLAGIRVHGFDVRSLDEVMRALGFVREAFRHPLLNSLVIRWRRSASAG
jgi:2-polyprenyl-3-methyl-5-hydroxy-6-metoxy-1,4-benzoquinol methylase